MIKKAIVGGLIIIVCFLENIGHYFGLCFHGFMAQIVGCLAAGGFAIGIYFKDIQIWLSSRKYGDRQPHKCKNHDHKLED